MSMSDYDSGRFTHREELLHAEIAGLKDVVNVAYYNNFVLEEAVEMASRNAGVDFLEYARVVMKHLLARRVEVHAEEGKRAWMEKHKGEPDLVMRVTGEEV